MEHEITSLVQLRRALHSQPELSGQEGSTSALVAARLRALNPSGLIADLGVHGSAGDLR